MGQHGRKKKNLVRRFTPRATTYCLEPPPHERFGAGNWFGYEVDDAPLHNLTASQLPPTTIALTIFGAIGQFVELDYRLKFTGTGTASNGFNEGDNGSGTFAGSFGHTLAWGRTDSVNDCEDRRADRGHFVYVHFRL